MTEKIFNEQVVVSSWEVFASKQQFHPWPEIWLPELLRLNCYENILLHWHFLTIYLKILPIVFNAF